MPLKRVAGVSVIVSPAGRINNKQGDHMAETNELASLSARIQALEMRKAFGGLTPAEDAELSKLKTEYAQRKAGF